MGVPADEARRIMAIQAALLVAVALAYWLAEGMHPARSAAYGGVIALVAGWMLGRRVRLAKEVARVAPGRETTVLYIGAVQRFVTILALFALGMGWLNLSPVPILVAFGMAQAAFFFAKVDVRARSNRNSGVSG